MLFRKILFVTILVNSFNVISQEDTLKFPYLQVDSMFIERNSMRIDIESNSKSLEDEHLEYTNEILLHEDMKEFSSFMNDSNYCAESRWEGLNDINVSGKFEMIAFHGCRPASYTSSDVLKVVFYQFDNIPATFICAKTIKRSPYNMIVKQIRWSKGWQAYHPWNVGDKLYRSGVLANNLGVLIKDDSKNIIRPAYILKNNEQRPAFSGYKAYFNTPDYIKKMEYRVINSSGQQVGQTMVRKNEEEGSSFPISINLPPEAVTGVYTLKISIIWENNRTEEPEYFFYHAK